MKYYFFLNLLTFKQKSGWGVSIFANKCPHQMILSHFLKPVHWLWYCLKLKQEFLVKEKEKSITDLDHLHRYVILNGEKRVKVRLNIYIFFK